VDNNDITQDLSNTQIRQLILTCKFLRMKRKLLSFFRREKVKAHWIGRSVKRWAMQYPERVKFVFIVGKTKFYFWISISLDEPKRYPVP
jgi:hypothetical protein